MPEEVSKVAEHLQLCKGRILQDKPLLLISLPSIMLGMAAIWDCPWQSYRQRLGTSPVIGGISEVALRLSGLYLDRCPEVDLC